MSDITRAMFDSLLPDGAVWAPKDDGGFDLLLDGISDNYEDVLEFLENLAYLRDPQRTTILTDLEKEYGVVPNVSLTIQERRDRLSVQKNDRISDGSQAFLEEKIRDSGFDLYVYQNNPPINPAVLATGIYQMYAGGYNAYAGRTDAYAKGLDIELIVNGDIFYNDHTKIDYTVPVVSGLWHLIFFIGGAVTRDPITDEILTMDPAIIPVTRRQELIKLVMKYKPMHSWAYAKIFFTS